MTKKEENEVTGLGSGGYLNPLGRASTVGPVAPAGADQAEVLARASIVGIKKSSMTPGAVQLAVSSTASSSSTPSWRPHSACRYILE